LADFAGGGVSADRIQDTWNCVPRASGSRVERCQRGFHARGVALSAQRAELVQLGLLDSWIDLEQFQFLFILLRKAIDADDCLLPGLDAALLVVAGGGGQAREQPAVWV
jgi:hypothetical protein